MLSLSVRPRGGRIEAAWAHGRRIAFLAGLLHDFGLIVLALHRPQTYRAVMEEQSSKERTIYEIEMDAMGTNHFELGALVAEKWKLEVKIAETIRHHRTPMNDDVLRTALMDCLWAAVSLVAEIDGETTVEDVPETFADNMGEGPRPSWAAG